MKNRKFVQKVPAFGPKPETGTGLPQRRHANINRQDFDILEDKISGFNTDRFRDCVKAQTSTIAGAL